MFEMKCHKNMAKEDAKDVEKEFGKRIANFCNTYRVRKADHAKDDTSTKQRARRRAKARKCKII